jgi:tetratricopeptide (TPR) repeat protein
MPLGQVAAEGGDTAGKRKAACQDGDMRGKGEEDGWRKSANKDPNKPLAASARPLREAKRPHCESDSDGGMPMIGMRAGALQIIGRRARSLQNIIDNNAVGFLTQGNLSLVQGRHNRALKFYSLFLHTNHLREHQAVCITRMHMGNIFRVKGLLVQALKQYHMAVRLFRTSTAPSHVADVLNSIAVCLCETGSPGKSIQYFGQCAKIQLTLLGKGIELAHTLISMGTARCDVLQYEKAMENFETALEILQNLPEEEEEVARTYMCIGDVCMRAENLHKALEHYNKCIAIRLKMSSPGDEDVAGMYIRIAQVLYKGKQYTEVSTADL